MMTLELLKGMFSCILNLPLLDGDPVKFFGVELFDQKGFIKLMVRFTFNLLFILILVRGIYYPVQKRKDFLFAFINLSMIIFLMCFVLIKVEINMGFALGLFAIFGIIRYRTDAIPIKEMTYLFIAIGISVLNAMAGKKVSYAELLFANSIIIAATYGLEKIWLLRHEAKKVITYEKIEYVKAENHLALHQDLEDRTCLLYTSPSPRD